MSLIVTLSVTHSDGTRESHEFDSYSHCVVGRASDCDIRLGSGPVHADISRHHCLFEIDPPHVRVYDLGSRNGTFVNEEMLGQRHPGESGEDASADTQAGWELKDGDVVRIGHVKMQVSVYVPDLMPASVMFM
jgi:pSer/pThr/pTyr-binding forkhead associated (FHA) protein